MTEPALAFVTHAVGGFIAGFVLGVPYYASLWWNTRFSA